MTHGSANTPTLLLKCVWGCADDALWKAMVGDDEMGRFRRLRSLVKPISGSSLLTQGHNHA